MPIFDDVTNSFCSSGGGANRREEARLFEWSGVTRREEARLFQWSGFEWSGVTRRAEARLFEWSGVTRREIIGITCE